jgi:signal peptidase I
MAAETKASEVEQGGSWEIVKVVLQALVIAFLFQRVAWQPFNIPSASMEGTLLIGDYVFVSKFAYGYSKYSFAIPTFFWDEIIPIPFLGRILAREPERGDVIVFRKPTEPSVDYIKRLIGLPGDEIQMKNSILYINGQAVPKIRVGDFIEYNEFGQTRHVPQFEETMPNGVKYRVLARNPNGELNDTVAFKVPPEHYFMMGDNRDNSSDSRDPVGGVGYVPFENLIGKAQIIFFSCNEHCERLAPWTWPQNIRWWREFSFVH